MSGILCTALIVLFVEFNCYILSILNEVNIMKTLLKLSIVVMSLVSLLGCSSSDDLVIDLGENEPSIVGISDFIYEVNGDEYIPAQQINFGDCSGKEKFYNVFRLDFDKEYVIRIYLEFIGGSKAIDLLADAVTFDSGLNENIVIEPLSDEEYARPIFKLNFINIGQYEIRYSALNFTNCCVVEFI